MNAYSIRQRVLTNNIANAMTPGFQAQRVSFEEEYAAHLDPNRIRGRQTNENHMALGRKVFSELRPRIELRDNTLNDTGLNNVDIDQEMAEMAENQLRYHMSTTLIHRKFANIKNAIRGR
jgi:flagellar basal-body rod protein FlgB